MEKMIEIFESHKGFAQMKELKEAGIHTRIISQAVKEGVIEKVKPGLYKLVDYAFDGHESFASVCNANKRAVICLLSAASHYEFTTYDPSEVYVAVPHNTDKFILDYPPIKVYYFIDKFYQTGIEELETESGTVKIYSKEKTVIDLFRYLNKLGEDVALESLKTYLRSKGKKVNVLADMASKLGVYKTMEPFIKGAL